MGMTVKSAGILSLDGTWKVPPPERVPVNTSSPLTIFLWEVKE